MFDSLERVGHLFVSFIIVPIERRIVDAFRAEQLTMESHETRRRGLLVETLPTTRDGCCFARRSLKCYRTDRFRLNKRRGDDL